MVSDLLQVVRGLIRRPGTPLFATLTLGMGVAAVVGVGSVVKGVLLRDLPYLDPDGLVLVWRGTSDQPDLRGPLSPPDWLDIQERVSSLDDVAAVNSFRTTFQPVEGDPEQVHLGVVTGGFFDVLGIVPALGRGIRPDDDRPSTGPDDQAVVVLDHNFWERRFGGDPGVIGRTIVFGGTDHLVIGVMPGDFRLLLPADAGMTTDLQGWTPLSIDYGSQPRDGFYLKVLARLAEGAGVERAEAEVRSLAAALRFENPEHAEAGFSLRVAPLHDEVVDHVRPFLVILALVGGALLIVTCANVSALLLVRFMGRVGGTALRRALGAERLRLLASFLAETGAIVGAGTLLGISLAGPATRGMLALQPGVVPRSDEVAIDGMLVLATVALAALITFACGLGPALLGTAHHPAKFLRSGGKQDTRVTRHMHRGLVVFQVAASFLLLYGTGTLLAELARVARQDPGYQAEGVLTFSVSLPFGQYRGPSTWAPFYDALTERLEAHPEVVRASVASGLPTSIRGEPEPWAPELAAATETWGARRALHVVTGEGYFETLGIPVRAGRVFGPGDGPDDVPVAVVDETIANQLQRDGGEVVGRRIEVTRHPFDGGYSVTRAAAVVVGVVGTVPHGHPRAAPPGTIYLALPQYPLWSLTAVARGARGVLPPVSVARGALAELDPSLPVVSVQPLRQIVAGTLAPTVFMFALLAVLATMVVALTVTGLYGVISETVRQRGRDLGVRLALGETASQVTRGVITGAMGLVALGVAPGILVIPQVASWLRAAVDTGAAVDGIALGAAVALVLGVALVASWLPARRAGRIDPARVLRTE